MYDLIVIGAGPAGLAAATAAKRRGLSRVLVLERDLRMGGILNQCIHPGFGLSYFGSELTGPEYAERIEAQTKALGIEVLCDEMAVKLEFNEDIYDVYTSSSVRGFRRLQTRTLILAMGCRERSRGMIRTPGTRPAGVLTAGTAQNFVNFGGLLPGRRVLILGSGDVGLIMARRLTLEGAKVLACVEILPQSAGLLRNVSQCLDDFGIPLLLSHTITEIRGAKRVEGAVVSAVDAEFKPIPGTEQVFDCDTILLSVGLIPENELSRGLGLEMDRQNGGPLTDHNLQCSLPGVFACGNVRKVHDLADRVSLEGERAGLAAAEFLLGTERREDALTQALAAEGLEEDELGETEEVALETDDEQYAHYVCTICPRSCKLRIERKEPYDVEGNRCLRGLRYAREELLDPKRVLTTTAAISGAMLARCPLRSEGAVPLRLFRELMREVAALQLRAPVQAGEVVLTNPLNCGSDFIISRSLEAQSAIKNSGEDAKE